METTTCIVICVLIIAWATVKVCELYFKHRLVAKVTLLPTDDSDDNSQTCGGQGNTPGGELEG